MAENRLSREVESREATARKRSWVRPDTLPSPKEEAGYKFRWIRIGMRGQDDPSNISMKLREGWEPVKAVDHPEIFSTGGENERFKDNVVIGGLMLCKAPEEMVSERNGYFQKQSEAQMYAVDNNLMRENDPRMPLFHNRDTKVRFGSGSRAG